MNDLMRVPPEALRAAASDLLQLSGEVSHVQSTLRHHWGRLDAGWQSYARAGVDAQYEETVREIERMAVMLEQLGAALVKTAEIVEAADRDAAAFFLVEEVKAGRGKAPGLAKLIPDGTTTPQWEQEGFGWWAEAFEKDHGRPPTEEDYQEFRLSWELSGEGQVQWTEADWTAFYYARQAGLEGWMDRGITFGGVWTGTQVLSAVVALNLAAAALGAETDAALGLTDGLEIAAVQIQDNTRTHAEAHSDGITIYIAPGDEINALRMLTHELGHIVGQHSAEGPDDQLSYHQVWVKDVPGWTQDANGAWTYDTATKDAQWCRDYSINTPGEDFADTFSWYAYQHVDTAASPFGVAGSSYPALIFPFDEPDDDRKQALANALDDFAPPVLLLPDKGHPIPR